MDLAETKELLDGFEITACAIRNGEEIAFVAQDWSIDDPMEPHETRIFVYRPYGSPEEQWGSAGLGTCQDMFVAPSYFGAERWTFTTGVGDIFVVEDGGADFENPIEDGSGYIFGAKSIASTGLYFLGPGRKVVQRTGKNATSRLHTPSLDTNGLVQEVGFRDIDGFGAGELYACGGVGDFWCYRDDDWRFIDLSTNMSLRQVCCGSDELVYVLADNRSLFFGRGDKWSFSAFDEIDSLIGRIAWYMDGLILLTEKKAYEFSGGISVVSGVISSSPLSFYSHIACYRDKIFLVNGNEAAFFDGSEWKKVL